MRFEELGEQFIALSAICKNIAAICYAAAEESRSEKEDRPGCDHAEEYRMPLSSGGKTGFVCKACNAVVYDVTVRQEG